MLFASDPTSRDLPLLPAGPSSSPSQPSAGVSARAAQGFDVNHAPDATLRPAHRTPLARRLLADLGERHRRLVAEESLRILDLAEQQRALDAAMRDEWMLCLTGQLVPQELRARSEGIRDAVESSERELAILRCEMAAVIDETELVRILDFATELAHHSHDAVRAGLVGLP
jgi:hypothetical protein